MRWKLYIFDLDGTLADTRKDLAAAVNYARKKLGFPPLSLDQISSFVGDGINKLLERSFPGCSHEQLIVAKHYFDDYYGQHLVVETRLYPGVREVLHSLNGAMCAVLSNKAQEFTAEIVEKLGLKSHFKLILGSGNVLPRKPSPEPVQYILTQLQISPESAMMVGDTRNDILAGKIAGVTTCGVSYGFRSRQQLEEFKPDFLIDDIRELLKLI
ncbi:MAG: HAD family hydrolase [Calditrichaeota bacterium]|nr:MAG: HAD family hydrolase [Calditrichota bacterium]